MEIRFTRHVQPEGNVYIFTDVYIKDENEQIDDSALEAIQKYDELCKSEHLEFETLFDAWKNLVLFVQKLGHSIMVSDTKEQ